MATLCFQHLVEYSHTLTNTQIQIYRKAFKSKSCFCWRCW